MDTRLIELDKQVKQAFNSVKKDIVDLKQFQDGITQATIKNKSIFTEIIETINEKIQDVSEKLAEIDTNIKTFDTSMKTINSELYKQNIDVQKILLEQARLVKFKHIVEEQVQIKKDLLDIVERFEAKFKDIDDVKKTFSLIEKNNLRSVAEFSQKLLIFEKGLKDEKNKVSDKVEEVDKFLAKVEERINFITDTFADKRQMASELDRVEKTVHTELDAMYAKNIHSMEKELVKIANELSLLKTENVELKKQIISLNAQSANLINNTVSKKVFVDYQQENFNNLVKATDSLKEVFLGAETKVNSKFKDFLKENDEVVDDLYYQLSELKKDAVDRNKLNKELEKLNKTLYTYYKANIDIAKLDVAYTSQDTARSKTFFEKLFSYDDLDESKEQMQNIELKMPKVQIKPVEVKTSPKIAKASVKEAEVEVSTVQTADALPKESAFKRFFTNLFFEEVDVDAEKDKSDEQIKIDDKIVDLTDKVNVDADDDKKPKNGKKLSAKSSDKDKHKPSASAKKMDKRKSHERLYSKLDNEEGEVINLYDEE